ncbi:hypothetical protein L3i23_03660 [Herbiconiux sp. L3-i23]|nr:hypothetical protein L3i23_03660 [Herbiconiux sp. L3-i23]
MLASSVDEPAAVAAAEVAEGRSLSTDEMVLLLARAKAEAVLAQHGAELDGFVLGGDSAFEIDGVVYGKPHEVGTARTRWLAQRGRSGVLASGHWLIDARRSSGEPRGEGAVARAGVTFVDDMTDGELEAYLASGEPLEVAGAFTIDSLGGPFIERIDGDPSTVVGLSLPTFRRLLGRFEVPVTDLWNRGGALAGG